MNGSKHVSHRHHRAGHVVDHGDPAVVADQTDRDQQVVDDALGLQQHDPGGGPDQQRGPERHQHERQQQARAARRRMGNQMGHRIAKQQAQEGDAQTDDERAPEQHQVDAAILGLAGDGAVRSALQIDGVQVVPHGEAVAGGAYGVPGAHVAPIRVDGDQRLAPRTRIDLPQPPHAAHQDAPQPALHAVHAAGDPPERALFARPQQLPRRGGEHRL